MDITAQVFGEICFIFRKFLSYFNVKMKIRKHRQAQERRYFFSNTLYDE